MCAIPSIGAGSIAGGSNTGTLRNGADQASGRVPAPGWLALACRIGATVTRVKRLVVGVCERQALAEDADPLHDDGVVLDPRLRRAAAREAATESRTVQDAAERDHASRDLTELLGGLAVEQPLGPMTATVAAGKHNDREHNRGEAQPVQPHLATPP